MRNGVFPAILITKDVMVISDSSPPGCSGRKRALRDLAATRLQPLPMGSLEELRVWKCKLLTLESWDAYERNDFSEPKLLHLPIHRKALNSLTWDIWFPFVINKFLMFKLLLLLLLLSRFSRVGLPRGPPHFWDSPGENIGVGCHLLVQCIKVKSESEVAQ